MVANIICIVLVTLGFILLVISIIGTVKYPDFYCKLQVLGLGQTLALALFVIGIAFYLGFQFVTIKFILAMAAIFIAGPIGTHIVDKVAFQEATKAEVERRNAMVRARRAKMTETAVTELDLESAETLKEEEGNK